MTINRAPVIHDLKVWPEYFRDLMVGRKTAEIRYDDRDYRIGDILNLREWKSRKKEFTGRFIQTEIAGMTRLYRVIPEADPNWVVLYLRKPGGTE